MDEYFKKYMETAHQVGDPGITFIGTIRPTKSIAYMNERLEGIEPVPSLTYTRKVTGTNPSGEQDIPLEPYSSKDAEYFSRVVAHAEAREESRLISIFARQLNALNEERKRNLDYVFGRTD